MANEETGTGGRGRQSSGLVGWLLVGVMTIVIFGSQSAGPETEEPVDPSEQSSPVLRYQGRVALGLRAMDLAGGGLMGSTEQLTKGIRGATTNPLERLRAAVLIGELEGPEAALELLAAVEEEVEAEMEARAEAEAEAAAAGEGAPAESDEEAEGDGDAKAEQEEEEEPAVFFDPWVYEGMAEDVAALRVAYRDGPDVLSEEAREGLRERHGWFARLALAPEGSEEREELMRSAAALMIAVMGFIGVAAMAGLAGLVLFVVAIALGVSGKVRSRVAGMARTGEVDGAPFVETAGLFLLSFMVLGFIGALIDDVADVGVAVPMLMWLTLLLVLWPLSRGVSWADTKRVLGWHTGAGFFKELGYGFLGYLAGLPIVGVGIGLTIILVSFLDAQPSHPVQELVGGGFWQMVGVYVLACLWAPIVEETMFRGALFGGMRLRTGRFMEPALLSSLVFAAIHPQGVAAIPALMSLAIVFCCVREWRGSIVAPAIGHAVNNFFLITLMQVIMS